MLLAWVVRSLVSCDTDGLMASFVSIPVSGRVKKGAAGGALLLLAAAAAAPRGKLALGLAGGALANAGERWDRTRALQSFYDVAAEALRVCIMTKIEIAWLAGNSGEDAAVL